MPVDVCLASQPLSFTLVQTNLDISAAQPLFAHSLSITKKSHNRISNRPLPMGERQSPHPLSMRPSTPQPNSPKLPPIHRPHRYQIRMRRRRMRCLHRSHIQTKRRKTRTSKCKCLSFPHPGSGRIAHHHRRRNRELEGRCQILGSG